MFVWSRSTSLYVVVYKLSSNRIGRPFEALSSISIFIQLCSDFALECVGGLSVSRLVCEVSSRFVCEVRAALSGDRRTSLMELFAF